MLRRALFALLLLPGAVWAQIGESSPFAAAHRQPVSLAMPAVVSVPAGKPAEVELRFRVESGLHINSHIPHEKDLIPTAVKLDLPAGVEMLGAEYPQGADFALAVDPKHKLSVYTGEFAVRLRLRSATGMRSIPAVLHYQACDSNACMPPRNLPFTVELTAR